MELSQHHQNMNYQTSHREQQDVRDVGCGEGTTIGHVALDDDINSQLYCCKTFIVIATDAKQSKQKTFLFFSFLGGGRYC